MSVRRTLGREILIPVTCFEARGQSCMRHRSFASERCLWRLVRSSCGREGARLMLRHRCSELAGRIVSNCKRFHDILLRVIQL